eukprot:Awhi_evm1s15744
MRENIVINKNLMATQNLSDLLDLLSQHVDNLLEGDNNDNNSFKSFNLVNCVTGLNRLVKTSKQQNTRFNNFNKSSHHGSENNNSKEKSPNKDQLEILIVKRIDKILGEKTEVKALINYYDIQPRQISSILWAFGSLLTDNNNNSSGSSNEKNKYKVELYRKVTDKLVFVLLEPSLLENHPLKSQEIANIIWAFGKLLFFNETVINNLLQCAIEIIETDVTDLNGRGQKNIGGQNADRSYNYDYNNNSQDRFTSQGLSNTFIGIANLCKNYDTTDKISLLWKNYLNTIATYMFTKRLSDFNCQELANTTHAFAKLSLGEVLLQQKKKDNNSKVVMIDLNMILSNLLKLATNSKNLAMFSPQHLANLLYAVAKIGGSGVEVCSSNIHIKNIFLSLLKRTNMNFIKFNCQEVSMVAWALAIVETNAR